MAKESKAQRKTVERVMHEYKHGELRIRGKGPKVKNRKQAVAVALHEAGATRQKSPKENRRNLKRTKIRERKGETAQAREEGKSASSQGNGGTTRPSSTSRTSGATYLAVPRCQRVSSSVPFGTDAVSNR